MTGILFLIDIPKREYENFLKYSKIPNLKNERVKYEKVCEVIRELKVRQLHTKESNTKENSNSYGTKDLLDKYLDKDIKEMCRSEMIINEEDKEDDRKSYLKSSWDEMRQVVKRKKKLRISRPVRSIDVLKDIGDGTPLEIILSDVVSRLEINNAVWNSANGDKFWQVTFSLQSGSLSEELLQVLRTFGIGCKYQSSVSVLPCSLYYKSNDQISGTSTANLVNSEHLSTAWSRFSSSVRARTNLAQVLHDVKENCALTFDWLFMLLVAAFIAAIGLIENSTVILVASMLISPLMGPITAGTLGTAVQDRSLQLLGMKNEFLGLFMSLVMGFLVGLTICALDESYGVIEEWPTDEMLSRCTHRSLWIGIVVAILSGAGCALAVLGDYTASLVGVAISASLLPPAVNAGLLWSMALTRLVVRAAHQSWVVVLPSELARLGTASLCLTFVNIVCIFFSGIIVYKVKEVSPLERRDISWWKANRTLFNNSKQQNRDKSLVWDTYTTWCTGSSLGRKDFQKYQRDINNDIKTTDNLASSSLNLQKSMPLKVGVNRFGEDTGAYRKHNVQPKDNYVPLKFERKVSLEKVNEIISPDDGNHNEDEEQRNDVSTRKDDKSPDYSNMACPHHTQTEKSHGPTIEPSLSFTVDNSNMCISNKRIFDV